MLKENFIVGSESTLQRWPRISLLHQNSINLICDASSRFVVNNTDSANATVASAFVVYDALTDNFVVNSFKPLHIKSNTNNFSELVSILVGIENLYLSRIKQRNHTTLNVFTDSSAVMRKLLTIFRYVSSCRQPEIRPIEMFQNNNNPTSIEQLVAYYLKLLDMDAQLYHLKSHVTNVNEISKDFKISNGIAIDEDELIYLSSVLSMVDSLAIKTNKNLV